MYAITVLGSLLFLLIACLIPWLDRRMRRREQERVWARIEAWLADQERVS